MKKVTFLVAAIMLLGFSSINAKIIFVGSHGGVSSYANVFSNGWYSDPLEGKEDIVSGTSIEKVKEVANGLNGNEHSNGVDASIALVRATTDYEIKARVYWDAGNVTDAFNWIAGNGDKKGVYEDGDGIFLVGYSAGGKFVINLAALLRSYGYKVQYMGLIDPVVWLSKSLIIENNVEIVDVFIQQNSGSWAMFNIFQKGNTFFFYDKNKTEYHNYTVTGSGVNHESIDNDERIWGRIGYQMLFLLGMNSDEIEGDNEDVEDNDVEEIPPENTAEDISELTEEERQEIEQETEDYINSNTSDSNSETEDTGTPDPTPDINVHIDKVTASYQGRENYEHETNIYLGQEARMEVDIENKGDEDIYVDIEYFLDDDKNFSFDDSHKVGEDNNVKIEHGTRNNGQPENVIEHKQHISFSEVGMHYLYVRVTTNGDSDESGSSNTRDYAKVIVNEPVEIPVQNTEPTGKSWEELTPGEKAAILQIILG